MNSDVQPAVLTSSSSDEGNNSSVESDEADSKPSVMKNAGGTKSDQTKTAYTDFSHLPPENKQLNALVAQPNMARKEPTFPVKLHMIISNPEFQDIIIWLPHGRSWRILQQKPFEERVIPLYFRHGRFSSFARQVNGWGFRRITQGSDYNSYFHELFLRGLPHLCDRMRRLTAKDIVLRKKDDDEPGPDFYAISRDHPLPEISAGPAAPSSVRSKTSPAIATTAASNGNAISRASSDSIFDVKLAVLEKRREEIIGRVNCLASNHGNSLVPGTSLSAASPLNQPAAPAGQQTSDTFRRTFSNQRSQNLPGSSSSQLAESVKTLVSNGGLALLIAALNKRGRNASQQQCTQAHVPPPAATAPLTVPIPSMVQSNNGATTPGQTNLAAILRHADLAAFLGQAGVQQQVQLEQQGTSEQVDTQPAGSQPRQPALGCQQIRAVNANQGSCSNLLAQVLQNASGGNHSSPPVAPSPSPGSNAALIAISQLLAQGLRAPGLQSGSVPDLPVSIPAASSSASVSLQQQPQQQQQLQPQQQQQQQLQPQQQQQLQPQLQLQQLQPQQQLQQQSLVIGNSVPYTGNRQSNAGAALQYHLREGRLTSSDIAALLALNHSLGAFASNASKFQHEGGNG